MSEVQRQLKALGSGFQTMQSQATKNKARDAKRKAEAKKRRDAIKKREAAEAKKKSQAAADKPKIRKGRGPGSRQPRPLPKARSHPFDLGRFFR